MRPLVDEGVFNNALELLLCAILQNATDSEGKKVLVRFDLDSVHIKVADAIGVSIKSPGVATKCVVTGSNDTTNWRK